MRILNFSFQTFIIFHRNRSLTTSILHFNLQTSTLLNDASKKSLDGLPQNLPNVELK
jgi:hypothetical protein